DSGIYDVVVYRDEADSAGGIFVGQATGVTRPDVDAVFGLSNAEAGWALDADFSSLPPGPHTLDVYALSGCGWTSATIPVVIGSSGVQIGIDAPAVGQGIADDQPIVVTGWAAGDGGPGTGVDA